MAQIASTQKITETCPQCGDKKLKSLVYGGKETNIVMMIILICLTGGIGLIFTNLWRKSFSNAYCESCGNKFGKYFSK